MPSESMHYLYNHVLLKFKVESRRSECFYKKNFNAITDNVETASCIIIPSNLCTLTMIKQIQMVINALKISNSEECSLIYYNNKSVLPKGLYVFTKAFDPYCKFYDIASESSFESHTFRS